MSVLDVLRLGRRWWWILLLCPILAGGVAYIISSAMTPIYRAELTMVIQESQLSEAESFNDLRAAERQAQTYSRLVTLRPVLEETIQRLGLSLSPEAVSEKLSVVPIRDTQLIVVSASDASPERAATIANTVGQVFIDQITESEPGTRVRVAEHATPPADSVSPRITLNTTLASMLGLLVAAGLVALIGYLDDTVKNSEDVRGLTGKPALATIPLLQTRDGVEVAVSQRSPATESFRGLRTNLQFASVGRDMRSLVLTSARPGDGKTTTVANLGVVLAQGGQQVILVDADLRKPRLHKLFKGLTNRAGLTNVLISGPAVDLDALLQPTEIPGVRVLTTGPLPPNPPDLLNSSGMRALIAQLEQIADIVIIDSPPMVVSDPLIVAGLVDGIVVVTLAGRARSGILTRMIEDLEPTGTPLFGIVVNQVDLAGEDYYYYYQSYYASDSDETDSGDDQPPSTKGRVRAGRRLTSLLPWRPASIDDGGQ